MFIFVVLTKDQFLLQGAAEECSEIPRFNTTFARVKAENFII